MVKDASDDQKLKALGRPGQPSASTSGRHSKSDGASRAVEGGKSGSGSGFNLHGSFNKRGAKQGSFNRNSRLVSPKLLASPLYVHQPVVVIRERVRHFSSFWPSLTADDWILNAISVGVRIPFTGIQFQDRPGRNMSFSPELAAICQAEVDS